MSTSQTRIASEREAAPSVGQTSGLLVIAACVGPAFYLSSLLQAMFRTGFDIRIHPLSQLATGDAGWIQQATFAIAGVGVVALAVAHRRTIVFGVGWRSIPVLLAVFGAGLIVSGCFRMDPQNGFPVGAPAGEVVMSWHSVVHSAAAAVSFTSLAVACLVLVVRHVRQRRVWPAIGGGMAALVLLLPVIPTVASIQIALTGAVAFTWENDYALSLRARTRRR